ncbi:MAG: type II secretion system protein GspE [Verrucomicrobia bacterium]|nr:MAG: type II secretion system protein GspE [Verrucomicrobiota bacterium]
MNASELVLASGAATRDDLERIRRERGTVPTEWAELCTALAEAGIASETQILDAVGRVCSLRTLHSIPDEMLDPTLVEDIPLEWAREHLILPVRMDGSAVGVLVADPTRTDAAHDISVVLGVEAEPILAPAQIVRKGIERCYLRRERRPADIAGPAESGRQPEERVGTDILSTPREAPVTQMANLILLNAVRAGASDIHIQPAEGRLRVRYRIDGVLYEQESPPREMEAALVSRLKIMAGLDIAERRLPQDGTARIRVGERELDIRVSCVPVAEGERVVLRILHRDAVLLPLDSLGMPPDIVGTFRNLLHEPQGAIWVTGPTGSGKTTTLYAAMQELDCAHKNVMTIEDPVEYRLPDIAQMSVRPKIGLTFAAGLRHILRQDPDVILVGETRDTETAEIAVRASLTGHLVLSTLHTTDAPGAIIRLMDMGVPPYMLSAAVMAVIAQRLVRRLCVECREPHQLPEELTGQIPGMQRLKTARTYRAVGCDGCLEGYRGRTGIFEFMTVTEELRELIRQGVDHSTLWQAARKAGMKTLLEDGLDKVADGTTDVQELLRCIGYKFAAL